MDPNMQNYQTEESGSGLGAYMSRTFGWMFLGLALTFAVAMFTAVSGLYIALFQSNLIFVLTILELVLVMVLSHRIERNSVGTSIALFVAYAVLNGLVFSVYFVAYRVSTLILAFAVGALYFGLMAVYGAVTKRDLSGWGPMLMMGLIALLAFSVIGLLFGLGAFDMILCAVGLGLFMVITAYDTQKIKRYYYAFGGTGEMAAKTSIYGALNLYLDFVNIFLYVLRLLGRGSRK